MNLNNSDNNQSNNPTTDSKSIDASFNLTIPPPSFPNNEVRANSKNTTTSNNVNTNNANTQTINVVPSKHEDINTSKNFIPSMVENTSSLVLNTANHLDTSVAEALQFAQQSLSTTQIPPPSNINSSNNITLASTTNNAATNTTTNTPNTSLAASKKIKSHHISIPTKDGPTSHTITTFSSNKPSSNEFVRKLFLILENNAYPEIIRWTDDGDSFVVIDTGKFTSQILPNHFKHSNFASFVRQLNKYDFHKVKKKQDEKSKYGDLSWEFKHPLFRIHYEKGLDNIKRKITVPKKDANSNTSKCNSSNNNNSYDGNSTNYNNINNMNNSNGHIILTEKQRESLLQNTVSKDTFQTLRNKVTRLENELKRSNDEASNLKNEIDRMTARYTTLLESLIAFKTVHESLTSNFNTVCSILVNNGINVPQHLYNNIIMNQKLPTYSQPSKQTLKYQGPTKSSTSPVQARDQQIILNNIDNQVQLMNNPTNNTLMSVTPNDKQNLEISENVQITNSNSNESINSVNMNSNVNNKNNNHGIINPDNGSKLNTTNDVGNTNDNNNNSNSNNNNNNNIPANTNEVTLRKGFHVLLVEDDAMSIQLCSKFLRKYGCTVEVVTDGLSAISTLEKFRYDLVLMDIVMPNLDGATATSIVRSFDNQTPIIAMTGNIEDQDLLTYLQHGMNDILAKPFTRNDLHSMLIRYLKDRIPLCEQKMNSPVNNQLSANMLQQNQHTHSSPQLQQNNSITPTLSTSMMSQPQQLNSFPIPQSLQPHISMESSNTSHVLSNDSSKNINRCPTTFDTDERLSKKPRI